MKPTLLGGIPRSGTTLTCFLLNQIPNTLALIEPLDMVGFLDCNGGSERARFITDFSDRVRVNVLAGRPIESTIMVGEATNTFEDNPKNGSGRKATIKSQAMMVDKKLSKDFALLIKHPNVFAALLGELSGAFPVYMQIRNPLSVLASWHSLDHGLKSGRAPMAERFDSRLGATLDGAGDDLSRQIILVNWYFSQFSRYVGPDNIIRYEDIIASGGKSLSLLQPRAAELNEKLEARNTNPIYDMDYMQLAGQCLIETGGAWTAFYEPEEIVSVMER